MFHSKAFGQGLRLSVLCVVAGELWASSSQGQPVTPEGEQRYPYDPICAWGRIADGRGMLVRCLKEDEVTLLTRPPAASAKKEGEEASATASQPAAPGTPASKPETGQAAASAVSAVSTAKPDRELTVEKVGPVVVDSGELPLAVKKLSEPKDRYLDCVKKNGGLQAEQAEVQLRFLVRERGRAEGVSVAKSKGMSQEAARCIADVVDRRYVGYPAAPIVGATLPIAITYRK